MLGDCQRSGRSGWHRRLLASRDQELAREQALERRARCEDPTGLANRSTIVERFRLLRPFRSGRGPLAIVLIESDEFRMPKDRHWQATGDCVLLMLAQRIHQTLRQRDWPQAGTVRLRSVAHSFTLRTRSGRARRLTQDHALESKKLLAGMLAGGVLFLGLPMGLRL